MQAKFGKYFCRTEEIQALRLWPKLKRNKHHYAVTKLTLTTSKSTNSHSQTIHSSFSTLTSINVNLHLKNKRTWPELIPTTDHSLTNIHKKTMNTNAYTEHDRHKKTLKLRGLLGDLLVHIVCACVMVVFARVSTSQLKTFKICKKIYKWLCHLLYELFSDMSVVDDYCLCCKTSCLLLAYFKYLLFLLTTLFLSTISVVLSLFPSSISIQSNQRCRCRTNNCVLPT